MPEPISPEYLRETQAFVAAVPPGPWEPVSNDYGTPDAVGPVSYLECFDGTVQVPVVLFVQHAREALPRYVGEVSRQRNKIKMLEQQIEQLRQGADGGVRRGR
ncbi:hypothetical protein RI578_06795 [Streptomyces sp. BB1-1-1]|uniref:hypothetical protein n=1 Tax=Streptomyces sp. BB1-1-1 TaxID=3074430 RepID=UPI0028779CBA|nr:hypothetical protein [Streptomyces sp. BB1-1-1]WND34021.1 hypothetical protein RI578_06795 [Streptomyces sp. BB1-1-1]